jgi:hypothetical protein
MNWAPRTSLDDGLRQTIAFIDKNRHLYRSASFAV